MNIKWNSASLLLVKIFVLIFRFEGNVTCLRTMATDHKQNAAIFKQEKEQFCDQLLSEISKYEAALAKLNDNQFNQNDPKQYDDPLQSYTKQQLIDRINDMQQQIDALRQEIRSQDEKEKDIIDDIDWKQIPMTPTRLMIEFGISDGQLDEFQNAIIRASALPIDQQLTLISPDPNAPDSTSPTAQQEQVITALFPMEFATVGAIVKFQSVFTKFHEQRIQMTNVSPIDWDDKQVPLSLMMYIATEFDKINIESNSMKSVWKLIHFLRRFCIEKGWDGMEMNAFWTDLTKNGMKTDVFGQRMVDRVCTHFAMDIGPFTEIQELLPLWYHHALRRFKLYPIVLADCSVDDIVTLFLFEADDDDDEKERDSGRGPVDGVFCRFEKLGRDHTESMTKIVEWKEKMVRWILTEKVDGIKLMETNNKELIEGMQTALNVRSDSNEFPDRAAACATILDLCRQSAVHEILHNVKEQGVTRFDALKQYLVLQHDVDDKEIDILDEMVAEKGYESETLLLSEQWMTSGKAPWNQLECAQFIVSFFRDRECTL